MHIEAFYILLNGNHYVSPRTIKGCIILYICCFIICDIGTRVFKNWRLRYLFNWNYNRYIFRLIYFELYAKYLCMIKILISWIIYLFKSI